MDQGSILDHVTSLSATVAAPADISAASTTTDAVTISSAAARVSAAGDGATEIAGAWEELRFPAEDEGRSLADMAERDLHAALQLLAERAQHITGASGAAIALRQGTDMVCRASAGTNAPELGAYLATESGLSGESLRTRKVLRCDDAQTGTRVNRESCRELGIASVVVAPILRGQEVLGVFELFSGKAFAFGEGEVAAVERLGEMVEIAVEHAEAAQALVTDAKVIAIDAGAQVEEPAFAEPSAGRADEKELTKTDDARAGLGDAAAAEAAASVRDGVKVVAPPARKGMLWSAPEGSGNEAERVQKAERRTSRPFALENCKACGIPVSKGRRLCVLCEEKQWRGKPLEL